jgi:uncharacterized membrane protein YkvA (DUF1232 family)
MLGNNMKNRFFTIALEKAARMAGKPGRLMLLVSRLAMKLREVNWQNVNAASAKEKFFVLGRLVKAYAQGEYREIPWKTLLIVVAAIVYFLNPIDLLPDLIPVAGLTDDFAVLLWVYNAVGNEIDKFLLWEKSRLSL